MFPHKGKINMVLEKAVTDLDRLIRNRRIVLTAAHVKSLLKQLLVGLSYMHSSGFMHQDLKPENLFITADGVLKLGDFGHAARLPTSNKSLFPEVITDIYRPPELLFGSYFHTEKVDVWSVGCIFAEMILRQPLFRPTGGDNETRRVNMLAWIVRLLGTPDVATWKGLDLLPGFVSFVRVARTRFCLCLRLSLSLSLSLFVVRS